MRRADHIWQIGIGARQDPAFDVLAIPIQCPRLETALTQLKGAAGGQLLLLPSHWHHITLDTSSAIPQWAPARPLHPARLHLTTPVCSPYGIRLTVVASAPIAKIAESFGLPVRTYYITLAYALQDLSAGESEVLLAAVSQVLPDHPMEAVIGGVEHRRSVPGRPFTWSRIGYWSASREGESG